jgi:chitin disaccharide deacetylase
MRRLIVNADDLGADKARDDGIFEAIHAGVVTSVSILANGPTSRDVLRRLRSLGSRNVSPGVHLNLSEGKPLSSGLKLLTGPDGSFRGKALTQQLLISPGDPILANEIAEEVSNQIRALQDEGIEIRHLDGHQHVHVFPAAIRVVLEAAEKYRILWMRIPEESPPPTRNYEWPDGHFEEGRFFSRFAEAVRARLRGTGIRSTDYFRGLYLKGKINPSVLCQFAEMIPEGLTELMVHPGRAPDSPSSGPFSNFSTIEREQELEALMDVSFRAALSKQGVRLVPFDMGDPRCES